ncbi:hypothetical protein F0562_011533 [Nyssa sinensis]|uniref:Pentatricopeptide repeat-containing protein n=1 Tax=Nyssa sinensis TaxID=561372 RepID=A0A5J4ZQY4_9ASTE|nr:hypothetical protein F0562_011533 [Nyssa sinensis]
MSGYARFSQSGPVFDLFNGLRQLGLKPDVYTLSSLTRACDNLEQNEIAHGVSIQMGFVSGVFLVSGLVENYSKSGSIDSAEKCFEECLVLDSVVWTAMINGCGSKLDAIKMFDEISEPDVVSWTGRISAAYDGVEALETFKFCCWKGVEINEYTVTNVLSATGGPKMLKPGKQIHALCYKAGYLLLVFVCNALISMYGKCGQMGDAKRLFDEMVFQDSVSWNSLIAGYSENRLVSDALLMFSQMRDFLLQANKYTLASILEVVSNSNSSRQAMQIHSLIIKLGFALDASMLSCLITAYGKCNGIDQSKRVFADIDEVNVVHLNAMAATFIHAGYHVDALKLFQTTWNLSLEVDSVTFSIVLKACTSLTDLEQGRIIHSLVLKFGIDEDNFVQSAVIDAYCKCGCIDDAEKVFKHISEDNLAAWNAMIMGYAQSGCHHEVFDLFNRMSETGMKPDEITYLGVLSSCCHGGSVNEAQYHLYSMFELHEVVPCLEHYACMVDMLGRVGLLDDAKRTIDQMPIFPDAQIWQILLSACNIHGNVDLGKVAARELLELQPENDSAYILLSNLYASTGMWDAVGKLRREMKEKLVSKEPGSSWIQVRGSIHYFFAGDTLHPENKEIYMRLQSLNKQILPLLDSEQEVI